MLTVRVLGGLALEVDGETLPPPGGRCAALLAWLAIHPGMHARSRVAAKLWPDVLDESARRSLRTALLDLRKALGPAAAEHLQATRAEVGLGPPDEVSVDVVAFETAVAAGRLEAALDLATGELLPEFDYEWVYDAREAHQRDVEGVLERLADDAERGGDLEQAIVYTRRLVAMDPLTEEYARALIRRLSGNDDRAGALAAFERHRERLRTELRMAPSAATRALVEQIRDEPGMASTDATDLVQPVALPVALTTLTSTPLFGRADELDRLTGIWRDVATAGALHVVVLAGDPGIGKSRLGAELCHLAQREGATVIYGSCREDGPFPYAPFVEALRGFVTTTALAELAPRHADRFSEALASGTGSDSEVLRLFDTVTSLLTSAAGSGPVVLDLDDLHWADRPTLRLLEHVARTARGSRVLVLGTYRETEVAESDPLRHTLASLRRERCITEIRLGGLDEAAVTDLARAAASAAPPAELVREVHERTEGNPYFAEEFLHELGDAPTLAGVGVPRSIQELIGRRLERMSGPAREIALAASVAGQEFDIEILGMATDADDDALVDALDEAIAAHVVTELPRRAGSYGFAHALVRETLYERLSATRRSRLHGRIGGAIEQKHADSLDGRLGQLARHFEFAGDAARALRYHRLAGDAAARVHAADEAMRHYSRALDAAEELALSPADVAVYSARQARAALRQRAGDLSGAIEDAEVAVEGARTAGDASGEIEALNRCGYIRRFDDPEEAVRCHESALDVARSHGDRLAQAATLARLSIVHVSQLRLDEAVAKADEALRIARDGDDEAVAVALDAVKLAALQVGDLRTLEGATTELLELRQRAGPDWASYWLDDWVLLERAFVYIAKASWDEAGRAVEEAVIENRRLRDRFAEPIFLDARAWIHRGRGQHERAIAVGREAVDLARSVGSAEWTAWTEATLGWSLLEAGDAAQASEELTHGLAAAEVVNARAQRLRCTAMLAWATWELGERERALELADQAEALIAEITAPPGQTFLLGAHATLAAARVRERFGNPDRAARLVEPVLGAARDAGWVEVLAYALLLSGSAGVALDRSDGIATLEEGIALARDAGLEWVGRDGRARLDELTARQE